MFITQKVLAAAILNRCRGTRTICPYPSLYILNVPSRTKVPENLSQGIFLMCQLFGASAGSQARTARSQAPNALCSSTCAESRAIGMHRCSNGLAPRQCETLIADGQVEAIRVVGPVRPKQMGDCWVISQPGAGHGCGKCPWVAHPPDRGAV